MNPRAVLRDHRVLSAVVAITVLGVVGRLAFLSTRFAHWDEGRVGYDILRYMATGIWEYRPIVHGPFLPHVNKIIFEVLGPTDFSGRLIVALVGGLLPLSVWLYRNHLRDVEMIALAFFLAVDPILFYYSRFMRNDVLVAAFAFVAAGFLIRLLETHRARYLYGASAAFALAFTTKENAILYLLAMGGALLLLLDHRLFLARDGSPSWLTVLHRRLAGVYRGIRRFKLHIGLAVVEFLTIIVFFYAPRGQVQGSPSLGEGLSDPTLFPAVVGEATVGSAEKLIDNWIFGELTAHAYLPFLGDYLAELGSASGPLVVLAILGFLVDRYRGDRPRDLISFAFYWGFVSVLGYPIVIDIRSAWAVTHAVVPLAIPAAAGVALIYDWGQDAFEVDDRVSVALAGLILLLIAGQVAGTTYTTSYTQPHENTLVQFAQPADDMRPAVDIVQETARENEGLDVVWYGDYVSIPNESAAYRPPVGHGDWYNRLPLPWYLEASNATVNSTDAEDELKEFIETERPPVVIACSNQTGCPPLSDTTETMTEHGYEPIGTYRARFLPGDVDVLKFTFYVDDVSQNAVTIE